MLLSVSGFWSCWRRCRMMIRMPWLRWMNKWRRCLLFLALWIQKYSFYPIVVNVCLSESYVALCSLRKTLGSILFLEISLDSLIDFLYCSVCAVWRSETFRKFCTLLSLLNSWRTKMIRSKRWKTKMQWCWLNWPKAKG